MNLEGNGARFFEELKKTLIPSLKAFSFENDTTLHIYLFGHRPVLCGHDYRSLILNFLREILRNETVLTILSVHFVITILPLYGTPVKSEATNGRIS
ncbi:UNVERIFIED_CONTAM: hypothetical protein NCL1_23753 [Trichonephila clavipes]